MNKQEFNRLAAELLPCPICGGDTGWCDEQVYEGEPEHTCHHIVCLGKCKASFDMAPNMANCEDGPDSFEELDELKAYCADKFNDRTNPAEPVQKNT